MKGSTQRILTTHVGSLPRPPDLLQMIQAKERGEPLDAEAFARRIASAVAEVVRKQAETGIDIVADGEMGRFGFIPYVNELGSDRGQERLDEFYPGRVEIRVAVLASNTRSASRRVEFAGHCYREPYHQEDRGGGSGGPSRL
jgi:methionine synthase II (cobalamin-independent)